MHEKDEGALLALVGDVYGFYRVPFSKFIGGVWINAMQPFEFPAIADAINRHCVNPDTGQFRPLPADVVKMLQGTTQDSALVAWSKVDKAVHSVGPWPDVVFDDALIHRVLSEMGGWIALGERSSKDWDFVRNEFVNRYRGYKMRSERPEYLPVLTGIANAKNSLEKQNRAAPVLVGDQQRALAVMKGGNDGAHIAITQFNAIAPDVVKRLGGKSNG